MASPQANPTPLIFRIFFLYCEPISAISGAYLAFFRPAVLLSTLFPINTVSSITPVHRFLLINLSSLWLFFGIAQALTLRLTPDPKIWSALLGSMVIADVGFLYAPQMVVPGLDIYWRVDKWRSEDWGNIGFSILSLLMRIAFLVWVWQERKTAKREKVGRKRVE